MSVSLYGPLPQQVITTYASTEPQAAFWSIGVDWGSLNDQTSIIVLEVQKGYTVEMQATKFSAPKEASRKPELHGVVRLVHHPRLGTNFATLIDQVASIMADLPPMPEKPLLSCDATGLGGPILQQMRTVGLRPIGVVITSGNSASLTSSDWSVPKALLVGELRLALHQKRIKVAQGFRDRDLLADQLAGFQARISASGRATFEGAGDASDDSVTSLSLAWFCAKNRPQKPTWQRINIFNR